MDRGLLDNLKEILQERISFSESVRNNHAKGEDAYDPVLPRAVLFPKNNEELSKILILQMLVVTSEAMQLRKTGT